MGIRGSPNPIICVYVCMFPVTKKPKPDISTTQDDLPPSQINCPASLNSCFAAFPVMNKPKP